MVDTNLLTALKALSDASRLRIVELLAEDHRLSVEELGRRLSLSPGTVVHHLKRLREAGLVDSTARRPYVDYSLVPGRLSQIAKAVGRLAKERHRPSPARAAGELLAEIPTDDKERLVALRQIAQTAFERKRKYSENDVDERLQGRHRDPALLRRYLVDEGFMVRKPGGYRLRPRSAWPRPSIPAASAHDDQRSRASVKADTAAAPDA